MEASTRYRIGSAIFDSARGLLVDGTGRPVALRAQALKVLEVLVAHNHAVVTHEALHQMVWANVVVTDDSLVQCISEIRRAVGDTAHKVLRTLPRRGYAIDAEPIAEDMGAQGVPATPAPDGPRPASARVGVFGMIAAGLVIVVLAAVAGAALWRSSRPASRSPWSSSAS